MEYYQPCLSDKCMQVSECIPLFLFRERQVIKGVYYFAKTEQNGMSDSIKYLFYRTPKQLPTLELLFWIQPSKHDAIIADVLKSTFMENIASYMQVSNSVHHDVTNKQFTDK